MTLINRAKEKILGWLRRWGTYIVGVIFILVMVEGTGDAWTWWGAAIFFALFIAYVLWSRWGSYIEALRIVEMKIWGKPLDKEYWRPGEWKNTKVKFVWKKPGK